VADRHVVAALAEAAKNRGLNYIEGITQSKDSFYGQHEPDNSRPPLGFMNDGAWKRGRVMASEMESSAIFVICFHTWL